MQWQIKVTNVLYSIRLKTKNTAYTFYSSFNQADLLTSKFTDHSRNLYFFETIRFWQF